MSDRSSAPEMAEEYSIHILPQDAAIAVEALAVYAQQATKEGRTEDARRAFAAAGALASQIDDVMFSYSSSDDDQEN